MRLDPLGFMGTRGVFAGVGGGWVQVVGRSLDLRSLPQFVESRSWPSTVSRVRFAARQLTLHCWQSAVARR